MRLLLSKNIILCFLFCGFIQQGLCVEPNTKIQIDVDAPRYKGGRVNISISNDDVFPHLIYLEIFNGRFKGDKVASLLVDAGPKKTIRLEDVKSSGVPFSSNLIYTIHDTIGKLEPKIKDYRVIIPLSEGVGYKICQSPDGPFTTHTRGKKNAIDFCADENSLIIAAQSGVVIEVIQEYTQGGRNIALLGKENKIKVLHDDGLTAVYAHIAHKSAFVNVGDRVDQGQKLAKVGNVGYSSGPHLHFELTQPREQLNAENQIYDVMPALFVDRNNQVIQMKYGDMNNAYRRRPDIKRAPALPQRIY